MENHLNINNQFIPYKLALKLKELGFNEECLAWYISEVHGVEIGLVKLSHLIKKAIVAPLYQQAFDFFREKYNINSYIKYQGIYGYYYVINYDEYGNNEENCGFQYEEARLKCLTKLIQIAK